MNTTPPPDIASPATPPTAPGITPSATQGAEPGRQRQVLRRHVGRPTTDGAGVKLTRVIGVPGLDMLDPFLMLDEFRSDDPAAYIAGFPDHPHRGFETVTYMLAGRMRHGDHLGNVGLLGPGSVQWMTAGRGIIHSEMPEQQDGLLWGFQLWINLPARRKLCAPGYQDIAPERIPEVVLPAAEAAVAGLAEGGMVRVVAGHFGGATGPVVAPDTSPLFLDVRLPAGASVDLPVPAGHSAFVFTYDGMVNVGSSAAAEPVAARELAVLGEGTQVRFATGASAGSALLVAARPLREPVAKYGPFVMNTPQEIHQAVADFRAGRF
jgi:redox-sensitive bicupin YhaK (pirin superfamily)